MSVFYVKEIVYGFMMKMYILNPADMSSPFLCNNNTNRSTNNCINNSSISSFRYFDRKILRFQGSDDLERN